MYEIVTFFDICRQSKNGAHQLWDRSRRSLNRSRFSLLFSSTKKMRLIAAPAPQH
jgi:hypothetical protein